jgi:hypothetical protein
MSGKKYNVEIKTRSTALLFVVFAGIYRNHGPPPRPCPPLPSPQPSSTLHSSSTKLHYSIDLVIPAAESILSLKVCKEISSFDFLSLVLTEKPIELDKPLKTVINSRIISRLYF